MSRSISLLIVLALLFTLVPGAAAQASTVTVKDNGADIKFPEQITFSANFDSDTPIQKVVLEYGVKQMTCGQVIAKAFPDITPGQSVAAAWTWEMKQSGSLPPGATVWWRWRVTDAQGREIVTNEKETTWLDAEHDWQTITGGNINLHLYNGGSTFGQTLHDSAVQSLDSLAKVTGLSNEQPIDLYIYGSTDDLRQAVLYEPGWTGGLAYPSNNIVIIGIDPNQLDWGKRTEAHELTHVLVGRLTFSCLSDIPTWLNEGLAVYGEGGLDKASQDQFDTAVADDTLMSVRALSGGFSEDPAKADVSYSESYSIVKYLIDTYEQDKMLEFLGVLRDGSTVEAALQKVYGLGIDELEDAWRAAIKAKPRAEAGQKPTPTVEPTPVPTYVPVANTAVDATPVPTRARPTPTPIVIAQNPTGVPTVVSTPLAEATSNTGLLIGAGAVLVLVLLGIIGVAIINRRMQRMDS